MKRPICKITLIYTSTLVEGEHIENNFNLESTTYKTFLSDNFIEESFVVGSICKISDLSTIYDYNSEEGNLRFLKDYYYEDEKDNLIFIEKNDTYTIRKININWLKNSLSKEEYESYARKTVISLNQEALDTLINESDKSKVNEQLVRCKKLLKAKEKKQ